ncbi:hypothetical protein [Pseudomonas sp. RIT288]|jgi:hypothetical protein|uniref:hypothetical protein n=1 Tax=Pseudomonas sp. RIT288 TaxID=1470589 RepID=UPI00044DBB45|nr:hypothetical protein [Pseudomonas sp. RIT288]EZP33977.1 hypothetical protein BW33_00155 [Pseudomonas sp. RIT288]
MNPTITIETGKGEVSGPPREVLCSIWPLSQKNDELTIGNPIFSNHMVLIGDKLSEKSANTLTLPEAGNYLVDVGYPNGQSQRTTISVDENQNYRLIVQAPKQISNFYRNTKSQYNWIPRVVSAAPRRLSTRKIELEVSIATQPNIISLSELYEFASDLRRSSDQSKTIFEYAINTERHHELPLPAATWDEVRDFGRTTKRKWLIVSCKGKPQTLVSYPYGWFSENLEPFKLMLEKGKEGSETFKWSVSLKLTDPVYGSLVEYLTRRDLFSSLSISESERGKATTALYRKIGNPFSAAAAAYLFALGTTVESEHITWMKTLSSRYNFLPDGAIALGWKTLRDGRNDANSWETAKDLFTLAWSRGLPYYTIGLHLLVDALTLLIRVFPADHHVREMLAAAKAADVACVRTEPFTTLQIARYLGLPMKQK